MTQSEEETQPEEDSNFTNYILPQTLTFEGNGVDETLPGVKSKYGVTQTTLDAYRKIDPTLPKTVEELNNFGQISNIARDEFFTRPKIDKLPKQVQHTVFDFGYNSGPSRAIKILQGIVGAKEDGKIGPKTIKAVNDYIASSSAEKLNAALLDERGNFLASLIQKNPEKYGKYQTGWLNRLNKLRELYATEKK